MTQPIKTKPTDDGGSAFPHGEIIAEQHDSAGNFSGNIVHHESAGMSLRIWLAAQFLKGILSNGEMPSDGIDGDVNMAFKYADAVISKGKVKP
jgi:hypothetical protein